MGFIENNKALCMLSVLINTHMLQAARSAGVRGSSTLHRPASTTRTSRRTKTLSRSERKTPIRRCPRTATAGRSCSVSACVVTIARLWLETRVARYHNVYGPHGTWEGGREKAPAAVCGKSLKRGSAARTRIEIWGPGTQTRSFMFIDDCLHGTQAILQSEILEPINLGSSELVTINGLVDIVEEMAGVTLQRSHDLSAPKGVNGRNSDNTRIHRLLGWEPSVRLRDGMEKTYRWIYDEYTAKYGSPSRRSHSTVSAAS